MRVPAAGARAIARCVYPALLSHAANGPRHPRGIVNLTGCGQRDGHRKAAWANDYAAVITLPISAQTRMSAFWKLCARRQ